jgi:hypothetical protein
MDERAWEESEDTDEVLARIGMAVSKRKLRLFACAACRCIWDLLMEQSREMLLLAERYADGHVRKGELPLVPKGYLRLEHGDRAATLAAQRHASRETLRLAVADARWALARTRQGVHFGETLQAASAAQSHLLRDIAGNPFRPVALSPAWQTPAVLALAQAAYDNRTLPAGPLEPDLLAVLADALEDAGCTDADLLGHLRGPGPHVRGCWAVDTLLNKL